MTPLPDMCASCWTGMEARRAVDDAVRQERERILGMLGEDERGRVLRALARADRSLAVATTMRLALGPVSTRTGQARKVDKRRRRGL